MHLSPPSQAPDQGVYVYQQPHLHACSRFLSPTPKPAGVKGTLPCYLDVPLKGQSVCTHHLPLKQACCWQPPLTPRVTDMISLPISTQTPTNEISNLWYPGVAFTGYLLVTEAR